MLVGGNLPPAGGNLWAQATGTAQTGRMEVTVNSYRRTSRKYETPFHFSLLNNSLYWAGGQFWGAKEIILNNNLYFLTFFLIERNFRLQFLMILTYPSGWSFIKNFFLLKLSLRIFAQENVLILVQFWKTRAPRWATARFKGTPSWSWGNVILSFLVNQFFHILLAFVFVIYMKRTLAGCIFVP